MWIFTAALILFFVLELFYFKIANYFNIIDHPNERSSHSQITLRGGGIIFPVAFILGISIWQPSHWLLALAVCFIATISFLDDILTLNNKLRIFIHVLSVLILIFQVYLTDAKTASLILNPYSLLLLPLLLILIIGIINAYNFMDGINGITVLYSITTVMSIWWIQEFYHIYLLDHHIWLLLLAALLAFGFFNVRKKAKAFAGDIGSISMAFIICFLISQLMVKTEDLKWILLLGLYGLDAVATISCRIIRRENIFAAHCSHFYQYLANEKKWGHLKIAFSYALLQLALNALLLYANNMIWIIAFSFITIVYIVLRVILEGKSRLFKKYSVA
jgi:UDP-N-acetylmuramyl pentapeptide phosphotransferase/UDP-N-acetylglucosamine-1-phosphate transferase